MQFNKNKNKNHTLLEQTRTSVSVNGMIFSIPADKTSELINYLQRLQSIRITENTPSPPLQWNGQTLIQE